MQSVWCQISKSLNLLRLAGQATNHTTKLKHIKIRKGKSDYIRENFTITIEWLSWPIRMF